MTIVILDSFPGPQPPYAEWLHDAAADLVLVTTRADVDRTAYTHVLPDTEAVLDLAKTRQINAIVATAGADLVRAGALRDRLGVLGQGKDMARVFTDPLAMRELLRRHGVWTVPCGPVRRVSDLRHWGFPARVRDRRSPAWPTVAVLRDENDLRAFAATGLARDLMVEPVLDVSRRLAGPEHAGLLSVLDTLVGVPCPRIVHGLRSATGELLVDTVACDIDPATASADAHRAAVRTQAGLGSVLRAEEGGWTS